VINVYVAALLGLNDAWFGPATSITQSRPPARASSVVTLNETAHLVATLDAKEEPARARYASTTTDRHDRGHRPARVWRQIDRDGRAWPPTPSGRRRPRRCDPHRRRRRSAPAPTSKRLDRRRQPRHARQRRAPGPDPHALDKPVVAAVEGHAVAGGLAALWCDLRVAARDAVFGVYCRRWGVPLIDGGTVRLPGSSDTCALDMILTAAASGERRWPSDWPPAASRARPSTAGVAWAHELAPSQLCLRSDRRSSYEQWALRRRALSNEFVRGATMRRATLEGAAFASGGRHTEPASS
jgi:hypothetical protein